MINTTQYLNVGGPIFDVQILSEALGECLRDRAVYLQCTNMSRVSVAFMFLGIGFFVLSIIMLERQKRRQKEALK